jgi:PiT family inorganic phosphate transporter
MDIALALTILVIAIALGFDFTNGFHDAANAIATSVGTRALTPRVALALAAVCNFIGAFLGQEVAKTVQSITSPPSGYAGLALIASALLGAITWNLTTWRLGMPSSSSHALIGGLVGASLAASTVVKWNTVWDKVVIPMVTSPVVGLIGAFLLMRLIARTFANANPKKVSGGFRHAQTVSAAAMALGHGLQDAQKTMGVIVLVLITMGYLPAGTDTIPTWVVASAAASISLGTATGGKRIMRTLGRRVIDLDPARGFAAESVASGVLYTTAFVFAAPVSTTQVITGAILGAGAEKRRTAVRWNVGVRILWAWLLTLPAAAAVAFLLGQLFQLLPAVG